MNKLFEAVNNYFEDDSQSSNVSKEVKSKKVKQGLKKSSNKNEIKRLLDLKKTLADSTDDTFLFTKNKKTGEMGCANFFTNGEKKVMVYEGNGDGSDDKELTYEEFINNYDYKLGTDLGSYDNPSGNSNKSLDESISLDEVRDKYKDLWITMNQSIDDFLNTIRDEVSEEDFEKECKRIIGEINGFKEGGSSI